MSANIPQIIGKDKLNREVKDLSSVNWWGMDRKEISWYPTINYDKCMSCGICFITCGHRVFDWDTDNDLPIVAHPYNCMVACQTCANLCPCGAIEFPEPREIKRMIAKAKVVKKAFDIMEPLKGKSSLSENETQTKPEI